MQIGDLMFQNGRNTALSNYIIAIYSIVWKHEIIPIAYSGGFHVYCFTDQDKGEIKVRNLVYIKTILTSTGYG